MSRLAATSATAPADEVVAETFKVLVLGGSDVGKTSIVRLYDRGEVATNLLPTVGKQLTNCLVTGTDGDITIWWLEHVFIFPTKSLEIGMLKAS